MAPDAMIARWTFAPGRLFSGQEVPRNVEQLLFVFEVKPLFLSDFLSRRHFSAAVLAIQFTILRVTVEVNVVAIEYIDRPGPCIG